MAYPANSTLRERSFDRFSKALRGEKTDAHAVFHFYTFPFYHACTNVNLKEYFSDPKVAFETQLEGIEKLERIGNLQPDFGINIETSALGGTVRYDKEGFMSVEKMQIETEEEVADIKLPNPWDTELGYKCLSQLQYFKENCPDWCKVNAPTVTGPFTVAAQLRGITDFMCDTLEDPDFCEALIEKSTEFCIMYMKEVEKILGHIPHLFLSDDLTSFLQPGPFNEFVAPAYKALFKEFPDSQRWLHNDAQAWHLAESLENVGIQAWQYAKNLNPAELAEKTHNNITLFGGLDPLAFQKISAQETYDICINRLKEFNGNSRLVLGAGGTVNQIPVENLLAILKAADDYKIS
ncbi:MAG: uroporphyrinogen decarboxylase family protein [Eubacteriales bacterium]|nr:uroporphyrinogen decarboxylase family protein [Eubacteriales bacterium]